MRSFLQMPLLTNIFWVIKQKTVICAWHVAHGEEKRNKCKQGFDGKLKGQTLGEMNLKERGWEDL